MLRPWSDCFRRLPRQLVALGGGSGAAVALLAAQPAEGKAYRFHTRAA